MEEMPYLDIEIMTITFNRESGDVDYNHDGLNFLEAMSLLDIVKTRIQETPYDEELEDEDEDEPFDL